MKIWTESVWKTLMGYEETRIRHRQIFNLLLSIMHCLQDVSIVSVKWHMHQNASLRLIISKCAASERLILSSKMKDNQWCKFNRCTEWRISVTWQAFTTSTTYASVLNCKSLSLLSPKSYISTRCPGFPNTVNFQAKTCNVADFSCWKRPKTIWASKHRNY